MSSHSVNHQHHNVINEQQQPLRSLHQQQHNLIQLQRPALHTQPTYTPERQQQHHQVKEKLQPQLDIPMPLQSFDSIDKTQNTPLVFPDKPETVQGSLIPEEEEAKDIIELPTDTTEPIPARPLQISSEITGSRGG